MQPFEQPSYLYIDTLILFFYYGLSRMEVYLLRNVCNYSDYMVMKETWNKI
jgi:hypothetical protein